MTRPAALLALALLCLGAASSPTHAQPDAAARFADKLNEIGEVPLDEARRSPRRYAALWDIADSAVVAQLNAGRTAGEVNRALAGFAGYSRASEGSGYATGSTVFYSELPRETPSYFVAPVRVGADTVMLGVYNFGISDPGRVSVYGRRGGRWRRTGTIDARFAVAAHLLPLDAESTALVVMETFVGADRWDGYLSVWRLRGDSLRLLERRDARMVDAEVRPRPGTVFVDYTEFPKFLGSWVLGMRLRCRLTLAPHRQSVALAAEPLNPWVHVVESYYRLVRRTPAAARALLKDPALVRTLGREPPAADEEEGSLEAGRGSVTIRGERDQAYRVESRRDAVGRWRITAVTRVADPREPKER